MYDQSRTSKHFNIVILSLRSTEMCRPTVSMVNHYDFILGFVIEQL